MSSKSTTTSLLIILIILLSTILVYFIFRSTHYFGDLTKENNQTPPFVEVQPRHDLLEKPKDISLPQNDSSKKPEQPEWTIVFTYSKGLLPEDQKNKICQTIIPTVAAWIDRELSKQNIPLQFESSKCYGDQFLIPSNLLENGRQISGEGNLFREPINDVGLISYLEGRIPVLTYSKFVTIFAYITPTNLKIANYEFLSKYDFNFITSYELPSGETDFAPVVDGISLAHEFMHKLGASDKYFTGAENACKIDPLTGKEYDGYDIMCHRVGSAENGYFEPSLSDLIISDVTAREIKWNLESKDNSPKIY